MKLDNAIDPQRLLRARKAEVFTSGEDGVKLPEWHYRVETGKTYYVQTAPYLSCDCPDAIMRDTICKHIIAALMHERDPHIVKLMKQFGIE